MRRTWSCLASAVGLAIGSAGCEDGPTQTFAPAPPEAGGHWNDGTSPPSTIAAAQNFDAGYPTTGKTTLCSTDLKRQRWSWMLNQPIKPPRFYAGVDMAADDLWHGLSIEQAEATPQDPNASGGGLCQSVPLGFIGGCPSGIGNCNTNYWGNNQEVIFTWNLATHKVDQMQLQLGYLGTMTAVSKNGKHTYVVRIGDVIKKDGEPFLIDWDGNPNPMITELFNASLATFGPAAGLDTSVESSDCGRDGNCLIENVQGTTIFGFRPLVIYFQGASGVPQPALSTPTVIYNFASKFEPYGNLPETLTLDANGPIAVGRPLGVPKDRTVTCTQAVGLTFGEYRKNCIQVHNTSSTPDLIDTVNLNKVLNGLAHDQEHWTASVIGINQNFTSSRVLRDPDAVVLDNDTPQDEDIAQDWFFDLRARGHVRNDYNKYLGKEVLDLHGSALVYVEWARLMLQDVNRIFKQSGAIPRDQPPKRLGDPSCTGFDGKGNPNFAPGCSGLEGLIIPGSGMPGSFAADPSCTSPSTCLDPGNNWDRAGIFYGPSILRPGDIVGGFCVDPGTYQDCSEVNSPWFTAQGWVLRLLGNGQLSQVPLDLRDRRYYFKWFAIAFLKYLKAYSDFQPTADRDGWPCSPLVSATCSHGGLGPSTVAARSIDLESLFFDNNEQGGSNGFDKFEYVDREHIGHGQEGTAGEKYNFIPWDFEYGVDLIGGNQRYDNWYRRMDREELALYSAMLTDKVNHTPGQENNVNLTNLFGSQLLPAIWPTYACAIGAAGDPASSECGGKAPPLDAHHMTTCTATAGACTGAAPCRATCSAGQLCVQAKTWETGTETVCGTPCDFGAHPATGCARPNQTCVLSTMDGLTEACVDMLMDLNGPDAPDPHPFLYYYPSAWGRTAFSFGHSPITLHPADKRPDLGVAKISIPNFVAGPYTASPVAATGTVCPDHFTLDPLRGLCNADVQRGSGLLAPAFTTLVPWLEDRPGVGFSFPIDGQHDQAVTTGQIDFTGVLETYLIDYVPWIDPATPSCVTGPSACHPGFACDPASKACVTTDDTIQIMAIEAGDFLGSVFLCQDPLTGDVLHARQYDSALAIIDWLAAHPGGWDSTQGLAQPSAQAACGIIVRYSPYNNYVDFITSKTYGVKLAINLGAGLGRVIDATLYDPSITQTP